jgi:hypothetical protein
MVDQEVLNALTAIETSWNAAEAYVKHVERLRRGLVVGAAVNELRYAGRRMIEAYACVREKPDDTDARIKALELLGEVKHFCYRAQHDAIDGAVTYIDQALAKLEKDFGPDLLHEKFPKYLEMKQSLQEIGQIMAQSRGDRALRDQLYTDMRHGLVDELIQNHLELETSRAVFEAVIANRIRRDKRETVRFWLTIVIGAATLVAATLAVPMVVDRLKGSESSAASTPSTGVTLGVTGPRK